MMRYATVTLLSAGVGLGVYPALSQTIKNPNALPAYEQHHDYRGVYNGLASDINNQGTVLNYDQLDTTQGLFIGLSGANTPPIVIGFAVSSGDCFTKRDWEALDFYADPANPPAGKQHIAAGGWHCAPTSAAMYAKWLRAAVLPNLADTGNQQASIELFAQAFDTNDQTAGRNENTVVHLGTLPADLSLGLRGYITDAYPRRQVVAVKFHANSYRRWVQQHQLASVFSYSNTDGCSGHVVVATGVDLTSQAVRVQDPWDGQAKLKPLSEIQGGAGFGVPTGNPLTVPFETDWANAYYETVTLPDYGDAPSTYLQSGPLAASHEIIYREYLGQRVTYELDAFGTSDDDEQANVNNHDAGDDGFELLTWNPGGVSSALVSVTHLMDFELLIESGSELDLGDQLYVAAWFDWNRDAIWDANAEEAFSFSLLADFHGTQQVPVFFDTPIDAQPTWMRLRLARGEIVTPYGGLTYGEVEDSLVPEPGTLGVFGLAGVLLLARRRGWR